jgi:threonine/homoserine/homoserine lactone efflux protein
MPDAHTLLLFASASAALVAVPGPAVLYIVSRGLAHGRRAGLLSMLGIESGNLVQVLAATAGLAAIVASSAVAFSVVKYAGAAYLIFLGLTALLGRDGDGDESERSGRPARSGRRIYWQGFVVGMLNPKLALFLLAFLPQFIDPAAGAVWVQTLVLGTLFVVTAAVGDTLFALLAGTAGDRFRARLASGGSLRRLSGGILVGLGIWAAVAEGGSASD